LLDLDDAADEDDSAEQEALDDAPLISLHAIAGVRSNATMKVQIAMGGATLHALLDFGSTHNFIAEDSVAATGLLPQQRDTLSVTVANGERVPCSGMFRHAAFTIDLQHFTADFYVLPLAGYDVVLGTQWLATLDPLLWDFGQLTLQFWRDSQPVCWHGLAGPASLRLHATMDGDLLDALSHDLHYCSRTSSLRRVGECYGQSGRPFGLGWAATVASSTVADIISGVESVKGIKSVRDMIRYEGIRSVRDRIRLDLT
jgi:hypothetical protein